MVFILVKNYRPILEKNFAIPDANSKGIVSIIEVKESRSLTPIAIAIEMNKPIKAKEKSLSNSFTE